MLYRQSLYCLFKTLHFYVVHSKTLITFYINLEREIEMDEVERVRGHANKRKKSEEGSGAKHRARTKSSGTMKEELF